MSWTRNERRAIYRCLRKKARTKTDALVRADAEGLHAYPCPYSQIIQHWHLTHEHPPPNSSHAWYERNEHVAKTQGGMGYPPGWVDGTVAAARRRGRTTT